MPSRDSGLDVSVCGFKVSCVDSKFWALCFSPLNLCVGFRVWLCVGFRVWGLGLGLELP